MSRMITSRVSAQVHIQFMSMWECPITCTVSPANRAASGAIALATRDNGPSSAAVLSVSRSEGMSATALRTAARSSSVAARREASRRRAQAVSSRVNRSRRRGVLKASWCQAFIWLAGGRTVMRSSPFRPARSSSHTRTRAGPSAAGGSSSSRRETPFQYSEVGYRLNRVQSRLSPARSVAAISSGNVRSQSSDTGCPGFSSRPRKTPSTSSTSPASGPDAIVQRVPGHFRAAVAAARKLASASSVPAVGSPDIR